MREIKFRGISSRDGEFIYGSLVQEQEKSYILPFKLTQGIPTQLEEVRPETVMQYTGLKDKNGEEIYEGDVVRNEEHPERFVMKEEEGGGCGCCSRETVYGWYFPGYSTPESSEVIGNIYENPELMQK